MNLHQLMMNEGNFLDHFHVSHVCKNSLVLLYFTAGKCWLKMHRNQSERGENTKIFMGGMLPDPPR